MRRWNVTTDKGQIEDVGAAGGIIHVSGALVFTDATDDLVTAYAPGHWTTVEAEAAE